MSDDDDVVGPMPVSSSQVSGPWQRVAMKCFFPLSSTRVLPGKVQGCESSLGSVPRCCLFLAARGDAGLCCGTVC